MILNPPKFIEDVLSSVHQVLEARQFMSRLELHEVVDGTIEVVQVLAEDSRCFFIRLRRGLLSFLLPEVNLVLDRRNSRLRNAQRNA